MASHCHAATTTCATSLAWRLTAEVSLCLAAALRWMHSMVGAVIHSFLAARALTGAQAVAAALVKRPTRVRASSACMSHGQAGMHFRAPWKMDLLTGSWMRSLLITLGLLMAMDLEATAVALHSDCTRKWSWLREARRMLLFTVVVTSWTSWGNAK